MEDLSFVLKWRNWLSLHGSWLVSRECNFFLARAEVPIMELWRWPVRLLRVINLTRSRMAQSCKGREDQYIWVTDERRVSTDGLTDGIEKVSTTANFFATTAAFMYWNGSAQSLSQRLARLDATTSGERLEKTGFTEILFSLPLLDVLRRGFCGKDSTRLPCVLIEHC